MRPSSVQHRATSALFVVHVSHYVHARETMETIAASSHTSPTGEPVLYIYIYINPRQALATVHRSVTLASRSHVHGGHELCMVRRPFVAV